MSHSQIRLSIFAVLAACTMAWISGTPAQDTATAQPGGTGASSSASMSSGYSSAAASSNGQSSTPFAFTFGMGSSEANPLRQADQRFGQSTRDLIAKYQETTDPDQRETVREELNDVLTKHFDVRQQIRARELEELEAQVRRLRELHDRREEEKDQIVRDRLQQLLRDAEGLGWGVSEGVPGGSAVRYRGAVPGPGIGFGPARAAPPREAW